MRVGSKEWRCDVGQGQVIVSFLLLQMFVCILLGRVPEVRK